MPPHSLRLSAHWNAYNLLSQTRSSQTLSPKPEIVKPHEPGHHANISTTQELPDFSVLEQGSAYNPITVYDSESDSDISLPEASDDDFELEAMTEEPRGIGEEELIELGPDQQDEEEGMDTDKENSVAHTPGAYLVSIRQGGVFEVETDFVETCSFASDNESDQMADETPAVSHAIVATPANTSRECAICPELERHVVRAQLQIPVDWNQLAFVRQVLANHLEGHVA